MKLDLYNEYKIKYSAVIPLSVCDIIKPRLLDREGITEEGSVLLFLVPYYTEEGAGGNISCYAAGYDYHGIFTIFSEKIISRLRGILPEVKFTSFADHAPINEKLAAASAGLGVIGHHSLLINSEYSSFVFIGGIYSDLSPEGWRDAVKDAAFPSEFEIRHCEGCGACAKACPASCISEGGGIDPLRCLSGISQKKTLTADEEKKIKTAPFIWGCDICQLSCPITRNAKSSGVLKTPIEEFRRDLIPRLDEQTLDTLLKTGEFSRRAFSWRGPEVLYRNLKLQKEDKNNE